MARLNIERQQLLEPERMAFARKQIERFGYDVEQIGTTTLRFVFRGSPVLVYPYSGWFTGRTVTDGRGIGKLLHQLEQKKAGTL